MHGGCRDTVVPAATATVQVATAATPVQVAVGADLRRNVMPPARYNYTTKNQLQLHLIFHFSYTSRMLKPIIITPFQLQIQLQIGNAVPTVYSKSVFNIC